MVQLLLTDLAKDLSSNNSTYLDSRLKPLPGHLMSFSVSLGSYVHVMDINSHNHIHTHLKIINNYMFWTKFRTERNYE